MTVSEVISTGRAIRDAARNYAAAEQWLATYQITNNQRHLDTAYACCAVADKLYTQSAVQRLEDDEALACSEIRRRVSEIFGALVGREPGGDRRVEATD